MRHAFFQPVCIWRDSARPFLFDDVHTQKVATAVNMTAAPGQTHLTGPGKHAHALQIQPMDASPQTTQAVDQTQDFIDLAKGLAAFSQSS
jgi:hypothetical protein